MESIKNFWKEIDADDLCYLAQPIYLPNIKQFVEYSKRYKKERDGRLKLMRRINL
jgi:hypothetical protein